MLSLRTFAFLAMLLVTVTACGLVEETMSAQPAENDAVVETLPEPTSPATTAGDTTVAESDAPVVQEVAYDGPNWTYVPLTNARTGATFMLADFAGKTVFVEPMATWCGNCRAQQARVMQAQASLPDDEYVFISLSVEGAGMTNERLASYAQRNGFTQEFVVGPDPLLQELVNQFGRTVVNPPATPHFIISPTGQVTALSTGPKSSQDILAEVQAASAS